MSSHCCDSERVMVRDVAPAKLVTSVLESVHHLWKLQMSPEFVSLMMVIQIFFKHLDYRKKQCKLFFQFKPFLKFLSPDWLTNYTPCFSV